jgi:hypothetical protein
MKWRDWLVDRGFDSIGIDRQFVQTERKPQNADRNAGWALSVPLFIHITTQLPAHARRDKESSFSKNAGPPAQ